MLKECAGPSQRHKAPPNSWLEHAPAVDTKGALVKGWYRGALWSSAWKKIEEL